MQHVNNGGTANCNLSTQLVTQLESMMAHGVVWLSGCALVSDWCKFCSQNADIKYVKCRTVRTLIDNSSRRIDETILDPGENLLSFIYSL